MDRHLRDLRGRLTELHKTLLDEARGVYEAEYGPVASPPALLQLVLHHEAFAWLRALSGMISAIDEALDEAEGEVAAAEVDAFFRRARALLRSSGDGRFETRYREALQRSPEVVMAHAAVVRLLVPRSAGRPEA